MFLADSVAHPGQATTESRTRDQVRRTVGERGPVTARALADDLHLTPAAVRRHLDALVDDEAIVEHEASTVGTRRGRGRPARSYVLTDRGQTQLANSYEDIATAALSFLAERAGAGAVSDFSQDQMQSLAARVGPAVQAAGSDLTARTEALAGALSNEGFAASVRPVGEGTGLAGLQLCQGHCPVQHIAASFPQLCDAETDAISELLGVHVQRLATLAGGAHVCTTFVPTGSFDPPASDGPSPLRTSPDTITDERPVR